MIVARVDGDADAACRALDRVAGRATASRPAARRAGRSASTTARPTISAGRGRAGRRRRSRSATSRCARRRSTTCSSSSPATASSTRTTTADDRPIASDRPRLDAVRRPSMTTVDAITAASTSPAVRPRPAGFVHDITAIAGRALRAVPRDLEAVIPPVLHRAVLLRREHRRRCRTSPRAASPASTTPRSRCRRRSCSASPACRGRRRWCSTCRTATSTGCCSRRCGGCRSCSATWSPTSPSPPRSPCRSWRSGFVARRALRDRAARRRWCSSLIAALWSLAFAGFGYAIALKTGNPAAVQLDASCCSSRSCSSPRRTCPRSQLSRWLDTVAAWNPVTYLLEGLRSLAIVRLGRGPTSARPLLAIAIVAALSMTLCFKALDGRVKQK